MSKLGICKKHEPVTVEKLKEWFPAKRNTITEETVEMINETLENPDFDPQNFISAIVDYRSVITDLSVSMDAYINALKFCAYLETENNLTEAYKKARADDEFVASRWDAPTDSADYNALTVQASRYRRTKLVKQILLQSDMPLHLMFQGARYKAIAVLAREMEHAAMSKDRIAAAKELLAAVKPPENLQIELGIGPNKESRDMMAELNSQLAALALNQQRRLEAGANLADVQVTGIRLGTYEEAEVEDGA